MDIKGWDARPFPTDPERCPNCGRLSVNDERDGERWCHGQGFIKHLRGLPLQPPQPKPDQK